MFLVPYWTLRKDKTLRYVMHRYLCYLMLFYLKCHLKDKAALQIKDQGYKSFVWRCQHLCCISLYKLSTFSVMNFIQVAKQT